MLICILCISTFASSGLFVIQSMDDFWRMYDTAQSESFSFDVDLRCDLHFSNHERKMERPLGQTNEKTFNAYNGVFEGNNHTIFGLNMTLPYQISSDAAFFTHSKMPQSATSVLIHRVCLMVHGVVHLP